MPGSESGAVTSRDVTRRHADIAVVDDQNRVAGLPRQIDQRSDFQIGSGRRAHHQPDRQGRELAHQPLHFGACRIVRAPNAEQDFELRILLRARACEWLRRSPHPCRRPASGWKRADWGLGAGGWAAVAQYGNDRQQLIQRRRRMAMTMIAMVTSPAAPLRKPRRARRPSAEP